MPIFRGTGGSGNASTDAYASEISTHAQTATTKASEASTSATAAATSATASASSATASASSATAAASSATAAAATKNSIDEFYLGAQSSNPTVDNNGDSVTAGDWYFNTGSNTTRIYDGSAWQTINPDLVGDTSPQLGGTLDANGNTIDMGTNNITDTKVGQWDTAYGWGDHGAAGYLTGNQTITLSGAVTGSGTTSISTTLSTVDGGTY